ncbi:hypothetical protein [Mesorhizobium sp. NZP2077]|uniref:hypothetical protein n=1 Tax=Mesorhizobium sp. NZP2077 TaxID=2483404 RepID=UPI001555D264|nr:hypothetical protein [Mesorhizobium sp. NZP2077]QKD15535.1 hypothetical protein HGP13_10670 [Mesorhizobium sp. NZP2077]
MSAEAGRLHGDADHHLAKLTDVDPQARQADVLSCIANTPSHGSRISFPGIEAL